MYSSCQRLWVVFVGCRALVFAVKFFDGKVPTPTAEGAEAVAELGRSVAAKVQEYIAAMEKVRHLTESPHYIHLCS